MRKFSISFKHSEESLVVCFVFLLFFKRIDLGIVEGPTPFIYLLIYVFF